MRIPSRRMPPRPTNDPSRAGCYLVLTLIGAGLLVVGYYIPMVVIVLLALIATISFVDCVTGVFEDRRKARMALERPGESICTFARSFDYRKIDTWVIRAVFEELQVYCRFDGGTLPLRASDELLDVPRIHPEYLNDVAADMAFRAGRSFEDRDCVNNPYFGKVRTVADLVMFLENQPRIQAA